MSRRDGIMPRVKPNAMFQNPDNKRTFFVGWNSSEFCNMSPCHRAAVIHICESIAKQVKESGDVGKW